MARALCGSATGANESHAVEAMAHRFATPEGRQCYALRKHTPEPVFGIIKSVMGFRQFLLRGLEKVKGEWRLVTMAWNVKRMFALMTV
jgi:Transposase DDE domain